jgi:AhpD family alkylhydroperoxidase
MRLAILDSGHVFGTRALFALIRMATRQPVLDVLKLVKYRPDFYGTPMSAVTHEAMRGPSAWSVGDRELMAAVVAKTSGCEWCTRAHSAVAQGAYRDAAKVSAVISDLDTAPIEEPLRATLVMLRKLTREHAVDADDMRAVLAAGVTREQIEDALAVCFAFRSSKPVRNTFSRVATVDDGTAMPLDIPPQTRGAIAERAPSEDALRHSPSHRRHVQASGASRRGRALHGRVDRDEGSLGSAAP